MKKLIALLLTFVMLVSTACTSNQQTEPSTPADVTEYNIIYTLATVPPVMAALESIDNGNETYAMIERGKTFNGIDSIEGFHNIGFDPTNNQSTGFTLEEFNKTVDCVKELDKTTENAFFNIYVQDGTALTGAAIAANAGLSEDEFHIYILEDGIGAYLELAKAYITDKFVYESDDEPYNAFVADVENAHKEYKKVMNSKHNKPTGSMYSYDIAKAYSLATLDNFTYILQDRDNLINTVTAHGQMNTKLATALGVANGKTEYKANIEFAPITELVNNLDETQRESYLKLVFGKFYEDTYAALTRETRADEAAPEKKLVYIGTRHNEYPKLASDSQFGIGGFAYDPENLLPNSYDELDDKYKIPMLYPCAEDYEVLIAILNDDSNYDESLTEMQKESIKIGVFNLYSDYIFTLKFNYILYGDTYDMIMKGHPGEVIGNSSEWGSRYLLDIGGEEFYSFDELYDKALLNFHEKDSIGKYIGMVPYGTAAENLAYLGTNMSICGLPSSTYTGYDRTIEVVNILTTTDEDITGSGSESPASFVNARYDAGDLFFTDVDGEEKVTIFYNTGNIYKAAIEICEEAGNTEAADMYRAQFANWLSVVYPNAIDIDGQGFAVME